MADLIEEANKGLIQSIDKFDVNQDVKVITYAKWQMECNMKKAVKEKENLKEEEFPEGVMVNLNEDALNDNEYVGVYENDAFSNETEIERQNVIEDVNNIISILNEREADFIKMYYGINPYDKEYTYQEIGKKYNLTKERVRQVIDKIMRKLRVQALTILEK
jgi:RNA polymerase primary sigma factor